MSCLNALAPKLQIFSYITKILINVKSQYVNKTLHVFLRTLPGNLQGPQTCACSMPKYFIYIDLSQLINNYTSAIWFLIRYGLEQQISLLLKMCSFFGKISHKIIYKNLITCLNCVFFGYLVRVFKDPRIVLNPLREN